MPDIFANITDANPEMLEIISNVLEIRAANPQQKAILESYLSEIQFPPRARVLEVGCGTGPVSRVLASLPEVGEVIGIDPSPHFLKKAQELSTGIENLRYEEGDGRSLKYQKNSFDVVILHTILTHIPEPESILAGAHDVLKPGGWLGVCDGDFSTASLATGFLDPLEVCTKAFVEGFVNDPTLVRRLTGLVRNAGFEPMPLRSYGHVETMDPGLTMTWVDRGADLMMNTGIIGAELAEAMKAEGRRRAEAGTFFGYMAYASQVARKPA